MKKRNNIPSPDIPSPEELREKAFIAECEESARMLHNNFTADEQLSIAVMPLILNAIAWTYAFKAVDLAVGYKVGILKKLTRAVKQLHAEYNSILRIDLDLLHVENIERQTEQFLSECSYDMMTFYCAVNQEFKKKMPDYPYDDLRTYAIMSIILIEYSKSHSAKMDNLISRRMLKDVESSFNPKMKQLEFLMEGMAGESGKFDYNEQNLKLCKRIFENNIHNISFEVN